MFFRRLNWNVVSWFRTVSLISSLIIAAGVGSMIWHGFQGGGFHANKMMQLGLSFTGGTTVDVTYTTPVSQDQLRTALAPLNLADETIRTMGAQQGTGYLRYSIETETALGDNTPDLWKALNNAGSTVDRQKSSVTSVGPTLGREYLTKAVEALVIAIAIQFIYIAFRFGWNYIFGLVTVIALVRDALMMIGIYAMAGKRADDAFLAAVLTVIGYSVMDTIVILDRIRENTKLMAGQAYEKIVNTSILQTMTRSFNTLATVVITLVALLALGGLSLQNFAFALLVGICSGGYHSIFFSAPLVVGLRKRQLAAAARKRTFAAGSAERTRSARSVAESKALGTHGGAAREDIVAARKARRQKAKATRPAGTTPTRYKRKRSDSGSATTVVEQTPDTFDEIDPLDAQAAGLDEAAFDQGHEEINLNLEGFEPERELPPDDAAEHGEK